MPSKAVQPVRQYKYRLQFVIEAAVFRINDDDRINSVYIAGAGRPRGHRQCGTRECRNHPPSPAQSTTRTYHAIPRADFSALRSVLDRPSKIVEPAKPNQPTPR